MSGPRAHRATAREVDDAAARFVARARVVVLTIAAVAAAVAFGEGSRPGLQYTLTFLAIPASVALALAADRLPPAITAGLGAVIDTGVYAVALVALPDASAPLTAGFAVALFASSYTGGRLLGALTGAAGIGVLLAVDALDEVPPAGDLVLLLVIAVGVSVAVVGRTDARLLRSAGRARDLEVRATQLLEHLAEAIVVTAEGGEIVQYNDAATQLLALPHGATHTCVAALGLEVDGRPLDCTRTCGLLEVPGSRDFGGVEAMATACQNGHADRSPGTPVLVSVAELPGVNGRGVEHLHTVRDITKLKLADEAKTLFLATATHELKTPLTVIRGFLETIDQPGVDDEMKATSLSVMRRRADELSSIIDRILLASRIESGHLEVDVAPIDVLGVARERVAALAAATARTIALHTPDDVPPALGDPTALATVLDHLLDNAGKYSQRATPITVDVGVGDRTVELVVRDRGVGMTADEMAHCFDRFWQADPTSRRKVGGTGIGLYIVQSLVRSMRGSVTVASDAAHGTAFTVALHRADVPEALAVRTSDDEQPVPEPSIVREFMRQIGVDTTREPSP